MRQWKYTVEDYRKCAEKGLTISETSRELGISRQAVHQASKQYDINFHKKDNRGGARDLNKVTWH
jgi:transposase-like protein|tara:strand:- start:505 stop:699 length:195 start_codon:yes stop_codon:yes gene_type:complete